MSSTIGKITFTHGFSSVKENDSVSKCFELLKREKPPVIAVLDDKEQYSGVISRRSVIRARIDPSATKVKSLMRSAPRVNTEVSLSKAAKLMIESGVRQLPVFEKNKLFEGYGTPPDYKGGRSCAVPKETQRIGPSVFEIGPSCVGLFLLSLSIQDALKSRLTAFAAYKENRLIAAETVQKSS